MENSRLFLKPVAQVFGSLRAFAQRLFEAFRHLPLSDDRLAVILSAPFQIRFFNTA